MTFLKSGKKIINLKNVLFFKPSSKKTVDAVLKDGSKHEPPYSESILAIKLSNKGKIVL